jgi:hypothetical protein
MLGRVALILVAASVLAGSAGAAATDPKKRHNADDQAWAAAIRIHREDLGAGDWRVERSNSSAGAPQACKDPDLSDLVETGSAENPDFSRNGSFVGSGASVFLTERQATTAWQRLAAQPITRCIETGFKRALAGSGARVTVFGRGPLSVGELADRVSTGRIRLRITGPSAKLEGRITYYLYAQGRATALLMVASFGKPLRPISPALERRLAALVASRLQK